jgi:hypothetical protein
VLSIGIVEITWLKIDVGFPRVLWRRTAFSTLSARWLLLMVVSSTQIVEDYPLPDGTVCDGGPPVLLELRENIIDMTPGNVEIAEMDDVKKLRDSV